MATAVRQPFAPLDGARLQNLTSLKNRQNSISNASVKRKAAEVEVDDSENLDPALFSKRSKGAGADSSFSKDFFKPSSFVLTKAVSAPSLVAKEALNVQSTKPTPSRPRSFLAPKSPAARLNTTITASSSLTAPAGRSPTRGSKRIGILSRRRTQRVDPPSFGLSASAPFSLDAALKGTIPSYSGRSTTSNDLLQPEMKSSWFFDIHEDTPEQEMTNLLQHSTCTLDISSDEESERRARREQIEGRNKENVPPADDISQTTAARAARAAGSFDDMIVEKQRGPLAEMNVADYYADGCDGASVIIVPGDEEEAETVIDETEQAPYQDATDETELPSQELEFAQPGYIFSPQAELAEVEAVNVDVLMGKDDPSTKAAVLQPIEGTGESFELWESGSFKDETENPPSPAPVVDTIAGTVAVTAEC